MAEPPTPSLGNNIIQPTMKLGGRGTPRRKTRRSSNTNHSASIAARTAENKLKSFRTQYQLQDQQELCDVTLLYDDGRIDVQNQVHVHSTWPMTIHEIDSSETGLQTYHINELDSTSLEYLCGNMNNSDHQSSLSTATTTNSSNYYNDLQQRQFYSQSSRYYMNYVAYQQNPYAANSYENYSNSIQQVYGGVNHTQSDDNNESIEKTSQKKRRRRRHTKTAAAAATNSPPAPSQEEEEEEDQPENENPNSTKPKRKRRRTRKSKKPKSDVLSSLPPTQHSELEDKQELMSTNSDIDANGNAALVNTEKEKECQPKTVHDTTATPIPSIQFIDIDKPEDEYKKITLPVIDDASTNNNEILIASNSDSHQKDGIIRASEIDNTSVSNNMSDENDDPRKNLRPKSTDAQSALENPKSTTVNNVSQRLPSTSAEVSVSEVLSTNGKRASVSIRGGDDEKHQSKQDKSPMDSGVTTRLLPVENENTPVTTTHLNPDAPDFKPTYYSELVPPHTRRRATHSDSYDMQNPRRRYHSETHQISDPSTIRPLLSIVPQYIPHHRKSWTTTTPLSLPSSNSGWPQESSNPSSTTSSYYSKPTYQLYTPLMEQQLSTDENEYTSNHQQHKYPPKRPRAYSGRTFTNPSQTSTTRKRSHSGPEAPLSPSSAHLNGVHSLTRIMVDLLRMIHPIPEEQKETNETEDSSIDNPYQQGNQSTDGENILIQNAMPSTAALLSSRSNDKIADMFNGDEGLSAGHHDQQNNHIASLVSTSNEELTTTSVPEPSIDEDEEEKSGNRSRHLVKNVVDEEQQKSPQTNSATPSSVETSKYFRSGLFEKKSIDSLEAEQVSSDDQSQRKTSSMNSRHSHRDSSGEGKNKEEEEENWIREEKKNDHQMCTITLKDGRNDKEIKSLYFMSPTVDDESDETKKNDNNEEKNIDIDHYCSPFTTITTPRDTHMNGEYLSEKNNYSTKEKNTTTTTTSLLTMDQQEKSPPLALMTDVIDTTNTSTTASSITATTIINNNNNKQDEQGVEATLSGDERAVMTTANVGDGGENHRDREKGEREKREDNVERTLTSTTTREQEKTEERERARQANKNTDSVTSFTSEQHSCPSVVRLSVDDSMANRVSSSPYNKINPNYQTASSSNTRSSRSTFTTHTYASTNTLDTEPIYTTTPTTGDPRTLHSYYVTSSNYRPPRPSPATSLTRHPREYEPSYPSITRYRTPSSTSPFRKTHYLDDSDEEIINEEILEITDLNHYPTLIERWGDDTKTVVRQEGELKIEDYVEFEETDPTIVEEILYELIYSGDKLKTCRQLDRSRSESRNFRKIKKRRTKRKRQPTDDSSDLTSQANSRDTSGTRSPYYHDRLFSPDRSITPTRSIGFEPTDRSSLDIPVRNRFDDQNYINYVRVNESDPFRSHTEVQQYPTSRAINDTEYRTLSSATTTIDKQATDLLDEMRQLSNQIDTLMTSDTHPPIITEDRGITRIQLRPTNEDHKSDSLLPPANIDVIKHPHETISSDSYERLLTSTRSTDNVDAQSRTQIIDQTSVEKETSREQHQSSEDEKQISRVEEESEKEDEEQSSITEPTVRENSKYQQKIGRDTDEDASSSENEQILTKSSMSDEQQQQQEEERRIEESRPSSIIRTNEIQDDHEIISKTTESSINVSESPLPSDQSQVSITEIPSSTVDETNLDLRSFLNDLTAHLLPELRTQFDEDVIDNEIQTKIESLTHGNEERPSSIIDTRTSTIPQAQESTTAVSTDSLVNIVEQIKRFDQRAEEQGSISPILTDEVSSLNLQSKQNTSQEREQQSLIPDTQKSARSLRSEDKSLSLESAVENIPSVSTTAEKQDSILRSSSPTTSHEPPSSTDEQISSESLTKITRQIGSIPQTTRLPQIDDKTETSQTIETPSIDSSVEIVQTNQSIPNQPVTTQQAEEEILRTVDTKDLSPTESKEISLVTENEQKPAKGDESVAAQSSSDRLTAETVELLEKPDEDSSSQRSSTDLQVTETTSPTPDATREILATPLSVRLPSTETRTDTVDSSISSAVDASSFTSSTTPLEEESLQRTIEQKEIEDTEPTFDFEKSTTIERTEEKPLIGNLTTIVREVPAKSSARSLDRRESSESTDTQETDISTTVEESVEKDDTEKLQTLPTQATIETTTSTTTTGYSPSSINIEESKQEHEGAKIDSSTDAISKTPAALISVPQSSDIDVEESTHLTDQQSKKSSTDSLVETTSLPSLSSPLTATAEDQVTKSTDTEHSDLGETTEAPSITDDTTAEIKAERLSSETLFTPLSGHLPSTDTTTEKRTSGSSTPLIEQVTVTQVETKEQPLDTRENEALQSTQTTSKDTTKEIEADRLSSEALTEAVREILATPLTVHLPSVEQTTETQQSKEPILETTATRVVVLVPKSTTITTTTETIQEPITEDRTVPADETTEEVEAERLSTDALTEAVREIRSTPLTVHLPSVDTTTEETTTYTEEQVEKPAEETAAPLTEQIVTSAKAQEQPVEVEKDEVLQSTQLTSEDTTKEVEADRLSSEALTEAVREILATPLNVHLPSVEQTTETEQSEEKLPINLATKTVLGVPVTATDTEEVSISKPTTTMTTVETVEEPVVEDRPSPVDATTKKVETDHPWTENLTEAVRQILAISLTVRLPTAEQITETQKPQEKSLVDSGMQTTEQSQSLTSAPSTLSEETTLQTRDIKEELTPESTTITSTTETAQESITDERPPSKEDTTSETEADRLSSEAIREAVHKIITTPVTVHLPSIDTTEEATFQTDITPDKTMTVQEMNPTLDQSSSYTLEKTPVQEDVTDGSLTETVYLPSVDSTAEGTTPPTDEHLEQQLTTTTITELEPSKTSSSIQTIKETTSEDHQPLRDDEIMQHEAERVSSSALAEAIHEILATSAPTDKSPSTDVKSNPTLSTIPSETEESLLRVTTTTTTVTEESSDKQEETYYDVIEDDETVEKVPTNSLTGIVSDILATPLSVRLPSAEQETERTMLVEQESKKPSTSIFGTIVNQIRDVYHDLTSTSEDSSTQKTSSKEVEHDISAEYPVPEKRLASSITEQTLDDQPIDDISTEEEQLRSMETSSVTTSSDESRVHDSESFTREKTPEDVAERVSSDAIIDAVREILITPPTVTTEQPITDSPAPHIEQVATTGMKARTSGTEIVEETTSEDEIKEVAAERLSSEAVTEAVREILATSLTAHLPSVEQSRTSSDIETKEETEADRLSTPAFVEAAHRSSADIKSDTVSEPEETSDQLPVSQETNRNETSIKTEEPVLLKTTSETDRSSEDLKETKKDEVVPTDSLTETVRQILATPVSVHLPSLDHTTKSIVSAEQEVDTPSADILLETSESSKTNQLPPITTVEEATSQSSITTTERQSGSSSASSVEDREPVKEDTKEEVEAERPSSEALTEAAHEILPTPSADSAAEEQPVDIKEDEVLQLTQTTLEDTTKEIEAARLSSEALTDAVREILATPLTVHLPSAEQTTETQQSETKPPIDLATETVSSVPVTTAEEPRLQTTETEETLVPKSTTITTASATFQEPITEDRTLPADETTEEVEAERLSTDALTEAVHEIVSTPLTVHLPSVDTTTEKATAYTEEQVEKSSEESTTPLIEQTVTREEVLEQPVDITKDELLQSTQTTSDDATKEVEADRLSSEALTEAVREILATPLTVHLPSVEQTTETVIETQQSEEPTLETTATKVVLVPKSTTITTTTETIQEPITEDRTFAADETTEEVEAERLSSEALTEAVREIVSTPLTVHLPSVDATTEKATTYTEEQVEKPAEAAAPLIEQIVTSAKAQEQPVEVEKDEVLQSTRLTSEDTTKEVEADRLSSEALTEAVCEILATPLTVHFPSAERTTETQQSEEKPSADLTTETVPSVPVTATEEPLLQTVDTEEKVLVPKSITITTTTETVEEPITEDRPLPAGETTEEVEAERLSTDALTEAVHEILSTPLTVHLPSVDTTTEKATVYTEEQVEKSTEETTTPLIEQTVTREEAQEQTVDRKKDEVLQSTQTASEDKADESEADRLSSEALTEAVREILATPLTVHLPSTNVKTETVEDRESADEVEKQEAESEDTLSTDSLTEVAIKTEEVQETPLNIQELSVKDVEDNLGTTGARFTDNIVETTVESGELKTSSDSLIEIADESSTPSSSSTTITTQKTEESDIESSVQDDTAIKSSFLLRPSVPTPSISSAEGELISDDDNQSVSSSLNTAVDDLVTDAIVDACHVLTQTTPNQTDSPSEKVGTDFHSTTEIVPESHASDDSSTTDLVNIVQTTLNLPNKVSTEPSLPHEDSRIIVSSPSNQPEQVNMTELTNIVDTPTKPLNVEKQFPKPTSTQRASAVTPLLRIEDIDHDTSPHQTPVFFVPGTPTPSETDFQDLYEHRHFVSSVTEEPALEFTAIDRQESSQSEAKPEERKSVSDLPLAYYELQEQRHTLMSPQQSTESAKEETKSPSLTTWTTTQPLIGYEETDKKQQETTDINLDDHSYEYARQFDLESPSVISNLPTTEYRRVFGISDEIVNTIDDMTHQIAQTLSKESENNQLSTTSDEIAQLQGGIPAPTDAPVSDNVRKISDALNALESDLSAQSSVSKTDEQNVPDSNQFSTALENDTQQTLEDQSTVAASHDELNTRYSKLFDRIDNLEKPLLDLQSTSETQTTVPETTTEDNRHLHERYDILIEHINELEDATNRSLLDSTTDNEQQVVTLPSDEPTVTSKDEESTERDVNVDNLAQTMEEILAKPVRTVQHPYEKFTDQEPTATSSLETVLEQILAATQFRTMDTKLTAPVDRITSQDRLQEEEETVLERKEPSNILEKVTSIANNVISSVTSVLPITTVSEDSSLSSKDDVESSSSAAVVETTTTIESTSVDEKSAVPAEAEDETFVLKSTEEDQKQEPTSATSLADTIQIPSPAAGYYTSNDVYHAYKQPMEPVIEEKPSTGIIDKARSLVGDIISTVTNAVPIPISTDDTSSLNDTSSSSEPDTSSQDAAIYIEPTTVARTLDEEFPYETVETEQAFISKPSEVIETQEVSDKQEQQTPSSGGGLLEIMKSFLPSSFLSRKKNVTSSEEPVSAVEDDQQTTATYISEETLSLSDRSTVESEEPVQVSSPVPGYFSSSDVYHAYKQPVEPVIEEEVVSDIPHKTTLTSDTSLFDEQKLEVESKMVVETAESPVSEQRTSPPTVEEKEMLLSELYEEIETKVDEVPEQPSSSGLFGILKSFISPIIRPTTSAVTTAEEDEAISSSSTSETTTTSVISDEHPLESTQSVAQIQSPDSALQTSATDEQESHGIFDRIARAVSNVKDTITNLGSSDEKTSAMEVPSSLPEDVDANEEKETLIETSREILADPLQFAVENYEHILFTQEEPTKGVTSEYPGFASQYKVADSEIERLSATHQSLVDESEQQETTSTAIPSTSEEKPSQQLQVLHDDYPWYSSYYTIADADVNMVELYKRLNYTIQQLDQRPTSTTVEFQPEPHEKVTTPEYDRQALADTRETREKVHELAQLSSKMTATTTTTPPEEQEKDEDGFQVVQRRQRVPSSTIYEGTSSPKTSTPQTPTSPDIDLMPFVLRGQPSAPTAVPSVISQTTTTDSPRSRKKKEKKKEKKEPIFFDASAPSVPDADEQKPEIVQPVVTEERTETNEAQVLPSVTIIDAPQIEQTSEEINDEPEEKLADTKGEEHHVELLSTSNVSDIEEVKEVYDEKNDSTSSDASQWFSSSYTAFPDDSKVDTQTTEPPAGTETTTTISSTKQELVPPETKPISKPAKKKKSKQKSTDQEVFRQPDISSSSSPPSLIEEAKAPSKPSSPTIIKTTTTPIRSRIVTSPDEENEIEDNEGFQVVSYRKRIASAPGPEKTSPTSSNSVFKQSLISGSETKATATQPRKGSSTSLTTPSIATGTSSSAPKQKPKKDKKETSISNPSLSSPSTDADLFSSSSLESSKGKQVKQQLKAQETVFQSQVPSLSSSLPTVTESNVQSKPILPTATLRVKAFTSPEEEEEEDDDNEGFQVVRHRKRILSAPRPGKSLPPLPPSRSHKQNYGRDVNPRPVVLHGRHGSESRSMPRATTTGQTSPSHRSQQNRPKQDRSQLPPLSPSRPSATAQETRILSFPSVEQRRTEQMTSPIIDERQSSFVEQASKPIEQKQRSTDTESPSILPVVPSKSSDQIQQREIKTEQISTQISTPVEKTIQQTADQSRAPIKEETKTAVQQTPSKEVVPPAASVTTKSKLAEDEDEDGFRVVRYRKHVPLSPTKITPVSQQQSFTFDTDKQRPPISREQRSSSSSLPVPTVTTSQTTTPKKKPTKPKKSKDEEESQTSETITTKVHEPVPSADLSEPVEKSLNEHENEVKPIVSTTTPSVTSADTSEELLKKPKKKHKRLKREPVGAELSTPSDEVSSAPETVLTTKPLSSTIPIQIPVIELPSTSSQIQETSDRVTVEEKSPPSLPIEPSENIEDEPMAIASGKKPAKRRKKKAHPTESQPAEESELTSSTTSTTDKDTGSTAATTPVKQPSQLISDDDKQHNSEWITTQSKKKKSKVTESSITSSPNEQTVPSSPSSPLQSTTPKIIPEKVTDVQFKFQKSGELTMTGQSSLERSPMEWGTVQFLSDEQTLPQSDQLDSPTVEPTPALPATIETETSRKSTESSETGGEGDLGAYRDETGRLRRKKPRKHPSTSTKPDETSSSIEQQPPEEHRLDPKSISAHWADALATPLSNTDEEQPSPSELIQEEPSFEDEDTSETSSKLDAFLPDYIRRQIKTTSTPRSLSFNEEPSKSSSNELSASIAQLRSAPVLPPSTLNRSTSTDTSESEGRKQLHESYSTESSNLPSLTNLAEVDTLQTSSSFLSTSTTRKKKQRPKMLKKDLEAKTLLTHEFDDTPLTITEIHQTSSMTQLIEDNAQEEESFLSSLRQQLSSAVSNISDSFTSALSSFKPTTIDEQTTTLQTDEPVPSVDVPRTISPTLSSESTLRKLSTRSPRKRSKRDSGPDYDNLTLQTSGDIEQSLTEKKVTTISINDNQPDLVKGETYKHPLRQRTSSGRQISNTEEEKEHQAILADDEADEDTTSKPMSSHTISSVLTRQSSSESTSEKQEISSSILPKDEVESNVQVPDELETAKEDIASDQQTLSNEQLRPVQGFHSFTPNKYQYNQYEEGPTTAAEPLKSSTAETDTSDAVLARGLNLWLQEGKEADSKSSLKKEKQPSSGSGLTRAMQSLVIQPVESDHDEDDEEDSWNGPRAKRPTYTTGIPIEKRIHTISGYSINHPRTVITSKPSWLISSSTDKTSPDDSSKFEPDGGDEDENSMDDTSDKQPLPPTIDTQFSTKEERQAHLNTLADLTFQSTANNLSSSSSSLSSTAKWNDTAVRSGADDNTQQQNSFTEDDVQRCLGEDFYRESLAVNTLSPEQRTITSLDEIVVKPAQLTDDIDDEEIDDHSDNRNTNNNNNNTTNPPINFDEWAHFLERKTHQEMFTSSQKTSSPIEQNLSSSPECSYARVLDDDTLVSDANRSNLIDNVQQSYEIERQRYGDFSSLDDDPPPPPPPTSQSTNNPTRNVSSRHRPSETFQRWRDQSNRNDLNESTQTSLENQNDDEILISHSHGGLSRRVRPSSQST